MSLKAALHSLIKSRNGEIVPYEEAENLARRLGRRVSNLERRARELMELRDKDKNPIIAAVRSKKNFIIGYRWCKVSYPSQMKLML